MTLFALDTDHLSLYQVGHPQVLRNLALHVHHALALTVITVEEELTGWQRALRQPIAMLGANTSIGAWPGRHKPSQVGSFYPSR